MNPSEQLLQVIFVGITVFFIIFFVIYLVRSAIKQDEEAKKKAEHDRMVRVEQALARSRDEEERRRKANAIWNRRLKVLRSGEGFTLIERFLDRFVPHPRAKEFLQLADLLRFSGSDFTNEEILLLMEWEMKRRKTEQTQNLLLRTKAQSREDLLKSYLDHNPNPDEETFQGLKKALKACDFYVGDNTSLRNNLEVLRQETELITFRNRLLREDGRSKGINTTDNLSGREFEKYLAVLFGKMGFEVQNTKLSGDQGADLVLTRYGERTLVQAKRAQARISNKAVQEIVAALRLYKGSKGMVVTNSYFTRSAQELAYANDIELIDRDGLSKLAERYL